MEIRLIKTFQTIVKLGSFQKAAEALQYSQPTVTVQIKKLEDELGFKLFDRGKTITLTSAGRLFSRRAEALLREYEAMNTAISDFVSGEAGIVRIGASEPSASNRLPGILASFTARKPKVQLQVKIGTSRDLIRMLLDDEIDIALCNQPESHLDLDFSPLVYEQLVLLLPAGHRLGRLDRVRLSDLKNEKFLFTPGTCPFRIRIEALLSVQVGSLRQPPVEVAGITAIKYFVQAGIGIALAPVVAVSPPLPGTIVKPIDGLSEGPVLGLLTRRGGPAPAKITEDLIEEITHSVAEIALPY
ncbi:LysR family transcriptional regulator [Saccharibacillus sp. CPCC 101409]|uniref:LysR family transcriptional regulator n=1 Tax=Saccharibacillus sp. CPCC 101409 TaxID=3058041 RepID=UPI0026719326|nr:LysR family transcriptional regulator [Saccharibacillus sp. CPCC 101409]MDO3408248.1 LysR family transcriptional regulator [Saccharibacillus sp. CPCC 101409]